MSAARSGSDRAEADEAVRSLKAAVPGEGEHETGPGVGRTGRAGGGRSRSPPAPPWAGLPQTECGPPLRPPRPAASRPLPKLGRRPTRLMSPTAAATDHRRGAMTATTSARELLVGRLRQMASVGAGARAARRGIARDVVGRGSPRHQFLAGTRPVHGAIRRGAAFAAVPFPGLEGGEARTNARSAVGCAPSPAREGGSPTPRLTILHVQDPRSAGSTGASAPPPLRRAVP
jgi:hypothetical protein